MVKIQQKTYLDHMISEADYEYLKRCLLRDERYTYYFLIRFMAATRPGQRGDSVPGRR